MIAAEQDPAEAALAARTDLEKYGTNARLLFIAQLRFGIDDIDSFAATCLTDGSNDKKCDLVYVSRELGRVVVAQSVTVQAPGKAPGSNKSADLNTAVSWLLTGDLTELPATLRGAAIEVREAIELGQVSQFNIWGVHNRPEDGNFESELQQAKTTCAAILRSHFRDCRIEVEAEQIGQQSLSRDYGNLSAPILVADTIHLSTLGGYSIAGSNWRAYCTAIRAIHLRELWRTHGTKLLSPNVRDYLGYRKSEQNINYGIKRTAMERPGEFVVFNNGITALVNSYDVDKDLGAPSITVQGFGIVNGGQTTGSLGELSDSQAAGLSDAWVQIRFVQSAATDIIQSVVQYNNTQNRVEAADFRSNDPVQNRLRDQFDSVPDAIYRGGRRGGTGDAIRRERNLLPDNSVVQALAAFHEDPNLAYNETREIWVNDSYYSRIFNDSTSATHIVFCYSLLKAIEEAKFALTRIPENLRISAQRNHIAYFSARGSIAVMTAAWGSCIETLLNRVVPSKFDLSFDSGTSPQDAVALWAPVVSLGLAFTARLRPAVDSGLQNRSTVDQALRAFGEMVEATRDANASVYDAFSSHLAVPMPARGTGLH